MQFSGKVVHGEGRGHGLGFPTINVQVEGGLSEADLSYGVYSVAVVIFESGLLNKKNVQHKGAMNWGRRPTFNEQEAGVEIHLLGFEGDLYGEQVEVQVLHKIRDVQKFSSKEELVAQIRKDLSRV